MAHSDVGLVTREARGGECALSGEGMGPWSVGLPPWLCRTEAGAASRGCGLASFPVSSGPGAGWGPL